MDMYVWHTEIDRISIYNKIGGPFFIFLSLLLRFHSNSFTKSFKKLCSHNYLKRKIKWASHGKSKNAFWQPGETWRTRFCEAHRLPFYAAFFERDP